MKIIRLVTVISLMSLLLFACNGHMNDPEQNDISNSIIGNYTGSIVDIENSYLQHPANVAIERISYNTVRMNLHSEILDTIIVLGLYENVDSIMICHINGEYEEHCSFYENRMHRMMKNNHMHNHTMQFNQNGFYYGSFDIHSQSFKYNFVSIDKEIKFVFEGSKHE